MNAPIKTGWQTSSNIYFRTMGEKRRAQVMRFSGGEIQVRIPYVGDSYMGEPMLITMVARLMDSDAVMELLLTTSAIREQVPHARIDLVMPYLPYARQDRVCEQGEALSLKVFAQLINAQNYNSVEVWDAHSDVGPALLDRCINIGQEKLVHNVTYMEQNLNRRCVVVAPDAGASKKASKVAKSMGLDMIQANKVRCTKTGDILRTDPGIKAGEVSSTDTFLIVDDICDGGRTFIELAKALRERNAIRIELFVTHGIFSNGLAPLFEYIDHIYTTNSVCSRTTGGDFTKITVRR